METENENKIGKKGGVIILVAVLILIITGLIGYICYDKGIIFSKVDSENKQSNVTSNKNNKKEEDSNTTTDNEETNGTNDESIIKELNLSQCLNTNNISYTNPSDVEGNYGLSMTINPDKTSLTLSIDWNKFGPLSASSSWSSSTQNYQITGFSKNIVSTFIGDLGQDATGITLFYLMADGTVEYTPIFNLKYDSQNNSYYEMNYTYDYSADGRIIGEHFVTKGVISGVNNIIKLYNVNASSGSSWRTTIAAKADGSFYDLGNIISK